MITAIINARSSSERLPSKHLMKIGDKSILEHIIYKLKKVKKIDQIYVASGSKNKNYIYEKFLKKRGFKDIKFFYYNNENDVTGRIYKLSKKIKDIRFLVVNVIMLNLNKLFIKLLPKHKYILA